MLLHEHTKARDDIVRQVEFTKNLVKAPMLIIVLSNPSIPLAQGTHLTGPRVVVHWSKEWYVKIEEADQEYLQQL